MTAPESLLGQTACRFCRHDRYLHNLIEGCPACRCMATPGEAGPRTMKEDDLAILPPNQVLEGFKGPKPPPPPMKTSAISTSYEIDEVVLTIWPKHGGTEREPVKVAIDPDTALDLLRDLASATGVLVRRAARSIVAGDCETCVNYRLVEQDAPGGRKSQVRCPDCAMPKGGFPPFPRVGGGVR